MEGVHGDKGVAESNVRPERQSVSEGLPVAFLEGIDGKEAT